MEILKQNWIFIVIVGLSIFLLLDINPHLLTLLGSLLLIDFGYDCKTAYANERANKGYSWKYWGYITLKSALVLAALYLFKYYA